MPILLFYKFLWERFETLPLKPNQFDAVKMVEMEENGQVVERSDRPYQPRVLRWLSAKHNKNKNLSNIDIEKNFKFRPYTFTLRGITEIQFYADLGESTIQLSKDEVPVIILTCLAIISPHYSPYKGDCRGCH